MFNRTSILFVFAFLWLCTNWEYIFKNFWVFSLSTHES